MDLTNHPVPVFTAVDGITQGLAAILYIAIGAAAWLRARADVRTRIFLAFSIANFVVFGIPTFWWMRGMREPSELPVAAYAVDMAALGLGALLLFHFTQVFPLRRPWIKSAGMQMTVAYTLAPLAIAGLVAFLPASFAAVTVPYVLALIVFGFPLIVLLGFVLPVAAIMSLVRSYQYLPKAGLERLRTPLQLFLLSQIAGGTLAFLFAPVLTVLAPNSLIRATMTVVVWAVSLLTPIAYALAIWRSGVLEVEPG
jgi:hypothetical protein